MKKLVKTRESSVANRRNGGFTLIELLLVISIISLLASVVLVALNASRAKARNARRVADVQQIAKALALFYNECNSYPALPSGSFGIRVDKTKSLYSGTASSCGSNDQVYGANGQLPAGGFGSAHTAGSGETIFVPLFTDAPTPADDGSLAAGSRCSENNSQTGYKWNEYSYTSFAPGSPSQYWLYFCIGDTVGNMTAGRYIMTERGVIKYTGNLFP